MKNIYISLDDHSMVSNMRKDNDTVSVGEVVDYICKLQAVANAAENMISQSRSAKLDKALAALKPKTTEQLLAERLEAADNLATTSAYCGDAVRHDAAITYEAAKAAHEASL